MGAGLVPISAGWIVSACGMPFKLMLNSVLSAGATVMWLLFTWRSLLECAGVSSGLILGEGVYRTIAMPTA